jgi:hypothetical protein
MGIHPIAFANTLGLTTLALAVFLVILRITWPSVFLFIFNAQFFGADVASLLPAHTNVLRMLLELLAFVGGAWGFGFVGAVLYNRFIEHGSP